MLLVATVAMAAPEMAAGVDRAATLEKQGWYLPALQLYTYVAVDEQAGLAQTSAIEGVVRVAARVGDTLAPLTVAQQVPSTAWPPSVADDLHYVLGRANALDRRHFDAFAELSLVRRTGPFAARSLLVAAQIVQAEGKQGIAADVYEGLASTTGGAEDVRDVASFGLASIWYERDDHAKAREYASRVGPNGPIAVRARLVTAWSGFFEGTRSSYETADQALDAIDEAMDEGRGWAPEGHLVRALMRFNTYRYVEAAHELHGLDVLLDPTIVELDRIVAGGRQDDPAYAGAVFDAVLGPGASPRLPRSLIRCLSADAILASQLSVAAELRREEARARGPVGRRTREALDATFPLVRDNVASLGGARLLSQMKAELARLRDLRLRSAVLRADNDMALWREDPAHRPEAEASGRRALALAAGDDELTAGLDLRLAELRAEEPPAERAERLRRFVEARPDAYDAPLARFKEALALREAGDEAGAVALLREIADDRTRNGAWDLASLILADEAFARRDFTVARDRYRSVADTRFELASYARYRLAWCAWALGDRQGAVDGLRAVADDEDAQDDLRASAKAEAERFADAFNAPGALPPPP